MILAAKLMMFVLACLVLCFLASEVEQRKGNDNMVLCCGLFAAVSIFVAGALQ